MTYSFLVAYGIGHFGKSLLWIASSVIAVFFLTEVVGLPPREASWLIAYSLLLNALCDLAIGHALGRLVASLRSAAAAQMIASVVAAGGFVAFAACGILQVETGPVYLIVSFSLFRVGYSCLDVPQNAMLALAPGGEDDRTRLSAVRYAAAGLASILVAVLLTPWILSEPGRAKASAFLAIAVLLAGMTVVGAMVLGAACARLPLSGGPNGSPALDQVGGASPSKASSILLFSIFSFSCIFQIFEKMKPYFIAYSIDPGLASNVYLVSISVGQIVSQPLWVRISNRYGLNFLHCLTAIGLLLSGILFYASSAWSEIAILLAAASLGATSSGLLMSLWAQFGHLTKSDPRSSVQRFGKFTFCSKMGQFVSVIALGNILSGADYRSPLSNHFVVSAMAVSTCTVALLLLLTGLCLREFGPSRATVKELL